ncbi:hypothetical protein FIU95_05215 [Microbulbifer sp. THAF38]|nr:hypothetical protein FIU95_05215 [Microbulbifer sp. THAF38]
MPYVPDSPFSSTWGYGCALQFQNSFAEKNKHRLKSNGAK